ncbi:MAG: energy-coupling factor transporter ATPase [Methanoculleus sp.]
MAPEAVLSLKGVSYTYPGSEFPALSQIDLNIRRGEIVLVTGPAGAGKTTLCLAASGILYHDYGGTLKGSIAILGKDIRDYPGMAGIGREVGVVFDDAEAQLIFSTVEEEVASGLENLGLSRDEMHRRFHTVMEATGISDLADRAPHTLSGGQKQRVAIAATLALGTGILILDEPTAELDAAATATITDLLLRLSEEGVTVLIVEQKLNDLARIAGRTILIEGGAVVKKRITKTVLGRPGDSFRPPVPSQESVTTPIISIRGLTHHYEGVAALKGVDLEITSGEIVAIIGENGSGKTTLIKHLNGLLRPTEGSVLVDGLDATSAPTAELARHVGLVFQNPDTMLFAETVGDEVAFGLENIDPGHLCAEKVDAALQEVGLLHRKAVYPRALSRGERQRLAVACVIAMKPRVIALDEPTTGLDAQESAEIMETLGRLRRDGHTIIMVSHDMHLVEDCADRIVEMKDGRIVPGKRTPEEGPCPRSCSMSPGRASFTASTRSPN